MWSLRKKDCKKKKDCTMLWRARLLWSRSEALSQLQGKAHTQNINVSKPSVTRAPAALAAVASELTSLRLRHRVAPRDEKVALSSRALGLLRGLEPFSVHDDARFVHAQRIMRTCAYFKLVDVPILAHVIQLHVQHTYKLDAQAAAAFGLLLLDLPLPSKDSLVAAVSPRLLQLADDLLPVECVSLLELPGIPVSLRDRMHVSLLRLASDCSPREALTLAAMLPPSLRNSARELLHRERDSIVEYVNSVEDAAERDECFFAFSILCEAFRECPRHIWSHVSRRAVASAGSLSNRCIAALIRSHCFSLSKDSVAMQRLSAELVTRKAASPSHAIDALAGLAHCHLRCDALVDALVEKCTDGLSDTRALQLVDSLYQLGAARRHQAIVSRCVCRGSEASDNSTVVRSLDLALKLADAAVASTQDDLALVCRSLLKRVTIMDDDARLSIKRTLELFSLHGAFPTAANVVSALLAEL